MTKVRPAAVAGMFYPGQPQVLEQTLERCWSVVGPAPVLDMPKALVVPHAGYVYSGAVAAHAYEELQAARGIIKRVVLLGPVHRVPVRGLALPGCDAFDTPLGRVPIDAGAVAAVSGLAQVCVSAAAHAQEHSLEVQLPFLQRALGAFSLLPLAVGDATRAEVAEVLGRLWGGPETLIVVSTDLSHYHAYDEARRIDAASVARILAREVDLRHEEACGATPLNGLLQAARERNLSVRLAASCNSGDTAGPRDRVVGYAAFVLDAPERMTPQRAGQSIIGLARAAIAHRLGLAPQPRVERAALWLHQPGATFITLMRGGQLRGCIGSLAASRSLAEDLAHNACSAAFADPRFQPLTREEWPDTSVEVSLLSQARRLAFESHDELLARLAPGRDGLVLECDGRRGTFLPQVWESIPEPLRFLEELKRKAGLPADLPIERCTLSRYRVIKWREARAAPGH